LIIMWRDKDVAKVWQEGNVTKVQSFDPSLQVRIEQIIDEAKKRIRKHDEYFELQAKKQGKKRSNPKIEFIERIGHFLAPHIVPSPPGSTEIKGERIWVDCVDEKTGERWDMTLGIAKNKKTSSSNRAK